MKCPKCGKELHHHYTRQINYFCDCGYNFKEYQFEEIVTDWQSRAEKAEGELARVRELQEKVLDYIHESHNCDTEYLRHLLNGGTAENYE